MRKWDPHPEWAALIEEAVEEGPGSIVTIVSSHLRGSTVEVVFDGGHQRPGRFGVHLEVPIEIGDERWEQMASPDTPTDWARIAAIVELLEPYEAISDAELPAPDSQGVRWLTRP